MKPHNYEEKFIEMKKRFFKSSISLLLAVATSVFFLIVPALALPDSGAGQYTVLKEIQMYLDYYALYPPDNLSLDGVTVDALKNDPDLFWNIVGSWLEDDPYGYFVLHDDYSEMYGIMEGVYGIGLIVDSAMPLGLYVIDILPGGGAASSGINPGAQIVSVDGVDIADVYQGSTRYLTQGAEGSSVEIGYINPGSAEIIVETIIRGPLTSANVSGYMIGDTDVGYIRVNQFGIIDDAYDYDYYYNEYMPNMGAESLIIDLRGNPGGELNTVLNIMNCMLEDEGYLLTTLVGADETESYYSTGFDPDLSDGYGDSVWQPDAIVILVNYGSASASEIMAGTMKSYGIASVVGEPTFGKSHSQYHIELSSGDYLITTFSRVEINEIGSYDLVGITPDYTVVQRSHTGSSLELSPLDASSDIQVQDAPAESVYALQERLALLGYYRAEPSGSFDDYTLWCLNRFQAVHGLPLGTYADSATLAALIRAANEVVFYEDTQFDFALALLGYGFDPSFWVNIFTDVTKTEWYYNGVAYVNFYNLMGGIGGGRFAPGDTMTRAMFAQVLYNIESRKQKAEAGAQAAEFSDVPQDEWFYDAVMWAASNGIVAGSDAGIFDPLRPVTRQEMAVMLFRYSAYKNQDIPSLRDMPDFSDIDQIADWAFGAARALSEAGVINGSNGEFGPQRSATRAEVAILLMNFMLLAG